MGYILKVTRQRAARGQRIILGKLSELDALGGWRRGIVVSGVRRMNARRAQLVPRLVTVFGRVYHLGMYPAK